MSDSNIRIVMTSHGKGEVFIDGKKVSHVTSVEFSTGVGRVNSVTLTVSSPSVEFEGPSLVACDKTSIESAEREYEAA
jgi:hypothetical protein